MRQMQRMLEHGDVFEADLEDVFKKAEKYERIKEITR